jgi:hypothetical protein
MAYLVAPLEGAAEAVVVAGVLTAALTLEGIALTR